MSAVFRRTVIGRAVAVCALGGTAGIPMARSAPALASDMHADFEQAMSARDVRFDVKAGGVVLLDRTLIEDDGPGAMPHSDAPWYRLPQPGQLPLRDSARVRKILHVARAQSREARLVLGSTMADARVTVNGVSLPDRGRMRTVPPELLREGDNEIELSAGDRPATALFSPAAEILRNAPERAAAPRRSFASGDGGHSWAPVDGELYVRLELYQFAREGELFSAPLPLTTPASPLRAPALLEALRFEVERDTPEGTSIALDYRTGPTPLPDAGWSAWADVAAFTPQPHGYLQWRARLRTEDPLQTPVLKRVAVHPTVRDDSPPWAAALRVAAFHNPELRFTSLPFTYEDFHHPRLRALREKYPLDRVVEGAASEFERIVRLRQWVKSRLKYDPPATKYPAWDADEILEAGGGFCVQFAITQMQVLLSMGLNARFVFGYHPGADAGHEVVEVWSNEYDKWVLMDGHYHHVDPETRIPLGMLEIQERMVRAYYGTDRLITPANRPKDQSGDYIWTVRGDRIEPDPEVRRTADMNPAISPRWNRWAVIRMMPRNDFYTRPDPVPAHQGFGWEWSGYVVWRSPQIPASFNARHSHWTDRRADWDWTLNRVRFDVAPTATPGRIALNLATVTPGFETFEVRLQDGDWRPATARLETVLVKGRTRIEMRSRNVAGVTGAPSHVELDYEP